METLPKQYRISLKIEIFVEAESIEEAKKIWIRNTKIEITDNDIGGKEHNWEIADTRIDKL